jgi:hypothetical protein
VAGAVTRASRSFLTRLEAEFEAARPASIPRPVDRPRLPAAASQ